MEKVLLIKVAPLQVVANKLRGIVKRQQINQHKAKGGSKSSVLDTTDQRGAGKNYKAYGNESRNNGEKTSIKAVIMSESDGHEK